LIVLIISCETIPHILFHCCLFTIFVHNVELNRQNLKSCIAYVCNFGVPLVELETNVLEVVNCINLEIANYINHLWIIWQ